MLRTAHITIACLLVTCAKAQHSLTAPASIAKPAAAKVEPVTDTYFGTAITDPYRWMETTPPLRNFSPICTPKATTLRRSSPGFPAATLCWLAYANLTGRSVR